MAKNDHIDNKQEKIHNFVLIKEFRQVLVWVMVQKLNGWFFY